MTLFGTLRDGFDSAVDTVSTVAQTFIEKKRTNAKLNRLRAVMKSESELMNRAYIAMGKGYYEQKKHGEKANAERDEKLIELIDNCKAKIAKARDCYRKTVEIQNEFLYTSAAGNDEGFEEQDIVDITVACSNENEYASSPFGNAEHGKTETKNKVKKIADELIDDESPDEELF